MSAFGSSLSDGPNNTLRQKLMVMENAVAQVTSVKNQLRINAEIARKEISNAIGHQLSLVRAREQLLLSILENVLESKERVLCEQQEQLNQAIGACQQSLESSPRGNSNDANTNVLFRISALDLRPHTNSHLIFQCDPSDMRRAMYNFGQVISDPSIKDRSDCLALEAEEYEDSVNLAHKSVLRIHRGNTPQPDNNLAENESNSSSSEPLPACISEWLYQARQNNGPTNNNGADIQRNRLYSENSSIEIISKSEFDQESNATTKNGFESYRLPMDQWLQKPSLKESATETIFPGLKRGSQKSDQIIQQTLQFLNEQFSEPSKSSSISNMDSTTTTQKPAASNATNKTFEFENVINSIKGSDASHWLATSATNKKIKGNSLESYEKTILESLPPTTTITFKDLGTKKIKKYNKKVESQETETNDSKEECFESKKVLPQINQEMSYWLKEYHLKNQTSEKKNNELPVNEKVFADDLNPWIIEKIHNSGEDDEWLVPASRKLKKVIKKQNQKVDKPQKLVL